MNFEVIKLKLLSSLLLIQFHLEFLFHYLIFLVSILVLSVAEAFIIQIFFFLPVQVRFFPVRLISLSKV